ncbi:hypothetical protein I4I84_29870 [Pseudonocardia sp. KRD-182]|uniref:hypothetical protein n=1 Tax=Pseudonocardia oceani TaxID=2792013 RepID=UPI001C4A541F|nr:hypothetical protein [Pseudonocardia oceani]MBW0112914.1 hypothetical protein [Pseudonocardia oceani]
MPDRLVLLEPLDGDVIELEGEELRIVDLDLGHTDTDTDDATALHVPSPGLVVAGDAAYDDLHLYLAESPAVGREAWLAALDALDVLDELAPTAVVAGHERAGLPDDPAVSDRTRRYILDFEELLAGGPTTEELHRGLLERHPGRVNPGAAWGSARSATG